MKSNTQNITNDFDAYKQLASQFAKFAKASNCKVKE